MVVIECSLILKILTNMQTNFILRWILSTQSINLVDKDCLMASIDIGQEVPTLFLGGVNFISSHAEPKASYEGPEI